MSVPSALDNLVMGNGLPSNVLWQRQTASEGGQGLTELGLPLMPPAWWGWGRSVGRCKSLRPKRYRR